MDWDDFKYVQAVARTGSVRRAGELLKVHGSTVVRHLDNLEQRVGTRLFTRTPRGMEITVSGAQVIEALDHIAAELDQVERSLRFSAPVVSGPVTVALPSVLAGALVVPLLEELYQAHRDVLLAIEAGDALERLQHGDAELALWVTDDPPEHLIGRPLGAVMSCVYGAAACVRDLDQAPGTARWVGEVDAASLSSRVRARHFADVPVTLQLDEPMLKAAALEAGLGVGVLPCYLGDARPGLVRAAVAPVREGELWLFTRPEARGVASVQAVSRFLQTLIGRQRHRIEGHPESAEDVP